jgi:hypothetical protein
LKNFWFQPLEYFDHTGPPTCLRDLVDISRGYQGPPNFLNFYTTMDKGGIPIETGLQFALNLPDRRISEIYWLEEVY